MGTSTEIYDYMRMLFARAGHTFSPVTGEEVKRETIEEMVGQILALPEGTRLAVLIDLKIPEGRELTAQLDIYLKQGYSRLEKDGRFDDISEVIARIKDGSLSEEDAGSYRLLIDRLAVSGEKDEVSRLTDSLETAYFEGRDKCIVKIWGADGVKEKEYSRQFTADGMEFREPTDLMSTSTIPTVLALHARDSERYSASAKTLWSRTRHYPFTRMLWSVSEARR